MALKTLEVTLKRARESRPMSSLESVNSRGFMSNDDEGDGDTLGWVLFIAFTITVIVIVIVALYFSGRA